MRRECYPGVRENVLAERYSTPTLKRTAPLDQPGCKWPMTGFMTGKAVAIMVVVATKTDDITMSMLLVGGS